MKYSLCLLAAGKGSRTQLDYNKVFYHLDQNKTVLEAGLKVFLDDPDCKQIVVVAAEHEIPAVKKLLEGISKPLIVTAGGDTRQESVCNGLEKVDQDYVLIHDAARPYLKEEQLYDLKFALNYDKAAVLMVPATDTVKIVDDDGYIVETLERHTCWNAQTPQAFLTSLIKHCHETARQKGTQATDDAQLVELYGHEPVAAVRSDPSNIKITTPADLKYSFD